MNLRYRVDLTQDERCRLTSLVSGGQHGSRQVKRAPILEEALLVATACYGPPAGRKPWTLERRAEEMVRLTESARGAHRSRHSSASHRATTTNTGATARSIYSSSSTPNMLEIEIGVLRSQCLERRIDKRQNRETEIAAWQQQRHAGGAKINCMFSTAKARNQLARD